jgi:phenylacetate-coenzyme A ligase PaaK-like adenylate-forming protein
MQIVGRIIKTSTKIGQKRSLKKGISLESQLKSLNKLLFKARKTNFGSSHDFEGILYDENPIHAFQNSVPMMDYDQFFNTWLHRTIDGAYDNTWPGKTTYFALSSGTTGSPSKRIPVTQQMIRSFQKTSLKQMTTLADLNLPPKFYQKSILIVGGSTELVTVGNHIEGDLSGILKKHTSWVASPFTKPGSKTTRIKDWNKKLDIMVEAAPKWDIGIMAGIPSWCIMLIERIIARYELNSIHDIWPNFKVYVHGGVFIDPYVKKLERLLGEEVYLLDTYLASEGYFAYQKKPLQKGMQLLLNSGIFYEFVPFTADYFKEDGTLINKYKALTLENVQPNVDYALIISTNAGLWRYIIGDLVQFTNVEQCEIKITGRIKQYLSLVGEHLSLDNIQEALISVGKTLDVEFEEYCVFPDSEKQNHHWTLGVNQQLDCEKLNEMLDKELAKRNDDYASARKYSLGKPTMYCVPTIYFYEFMEKLGKLGSQNKFPRVMSKHQALQWQQFLKTKEPK